MVVDRRPLLRGGRLHLQGQFVLQIGHAHIHRQRDSAHNGIYRLGPPQNLAGCQAAHRADQHGVGSAVELGLRGRQVDQCKQRAVRIALGLLAQYVVNAYQATLKSLGIGVPQQVIRLHLQVQPVNALVVHHALAQCLGREFGVCDFAQ